MRSTWTQAHTAVMNTVLTSLSAIFAAARAATTPVSIICPLRGARAGVDTCSVADADDLTRVQEVPR